MKKRILLVSESMGGGLRKHIVQLINNLDKNIFDIYFIHGEETVDSTFINEYKKLNEQATIIPCKTLMREMNFKNDLRSLIFILNVISNISPDIVHCHSSKAGVLGRIAAKLKGVKNIFYTPHAYSFLSSEFGNRRKKFFIITEKFLSRYATCKTFCVSKGEKNSAIRLGIDLENKIEVVYNGLPNIQFSNNSDLKTELGLAKDSFIIGNNARLSEQKNPYLFIQIAKEMIKKNSKCHFVWAGDGPLANEIKQIVISNSLESNIHLVGDRNDSEYIVKDYDIFLITSKYEGFPYAPIEALRAKVPVIGTDVNGISEIVMEGINGYLFDQRDYKKAIAIIEKVFGNKKLLKEEEIFASYSERFTQIGMIKKIENFYLNNY